MNTANLKWMNARIFVVRDLADAVANFCHEHGSEGLVLEDTSEEQAVITAYFPTENWEAVHADLLRYVVSLRELFPGAPEPRLEVSIIEHENWATLWQDNFQLMNIGETLLIAPPWLVPDSTERHLIIIEPAEAFGTGTHETTRGCLELLEEAVTQLRKTHESFTMLDMGCGSGILAIAGVKLGASDVRAVDNDPVAVESARKNLELNNVGDSVKLACASLRETRESADIVTANLDPMTLMANKDLLASLFRRYLIVSGVPLDQWDQVKNILAHGDIRLEQEIIRSEWGCGLFSK
ncbi:50S ribosomal protein L11 methyltransferase [Desulfomonile tiedjei]|uniref:Ribosomal protein L11 methyltransferase n=1 Tax=Desulfomonile tiedjei (strain ATCC 49306 / DSM 6799 / DCB-1) TaxID=706587 RepID=I4CAY3_DESTA|nr:50S ribosomal protein L11 methyltransferase [Desulfomonile tiedjei]AFM26724.1 ribosomal protein L11 methylase [Desulfomonile tiedjei DSM 6799]